VADNEMVESFDFQRLTYSNEAISFCLNYRLLRSEGWFSTVGNLQKLAINCIFRKVAADVSTV